MLRTVVVVVVLVLLAVTLAPIVRAYFVRSRHEDFGTAKAGEPDVQALITGVLGQRVDAADLSEDTVTLYAGGVSTPAVVLQKRELSVPLDVSAVDRRTVRFHGYGAYEVVASGAAAHADFGLQPLPAPVTARFGHVGPQSMQALASRKDVVGRPSRCWALSLLDPRRVISAHDLSDATTPRVPDICKSAALQAVSVAFSAGGSDAGKVSVYVLPRREGQSPVSLHVAFEGKALVLTYLLHTDAAGQGPAEIVQSAAAQHDRSVVRVPGARSGLGAVRVYVEVSRGRARVVTEEPGRQRGWALLAPTFLRDDESLKSDPMDPPALMVRSRNVEALVVLPFSAGDLRAMG